MCADPAHSSGTVLPDLCVCSLNPPDILKEYSTNSILELRRWELRHSDEAAQRHTVRRDHETSGLGPALLRCTPGPSLDEGGNHTVSAKCQRQSGALSACVLAGLIGR